MIEYNGRPFDANAKDDVVSWLDEAWGRTQVITVGVILDSSLWCDEPLISIYRYKGTLSIRVWLFKLEFGG